MKYCGRGFPTPTLSIAAGKLLLFSLILPLTLSGQILRMKRVAFLPAGSMAAGIYPIGVDSDHNGLNEIIFHISYRWEIWEHRPINQYQLVYADTGAYPYPPGIETGNFEPKDVGDIDQDGLTDLLGMNVENANDTLYYLATTQESPTYFAYPESLSWWYRTSNLSYSYTYYFTPDLDHDGRREILTYEGWDSSPIVIIENVGNNHNVPVWRRVNYGSGFAFGDFDQDGLNEFLTASPGSSGRVFVFENTGDNQYELIWVDTVRIPNGTDVFLGQDLDGDGKPEFFVGFAQYVGGNIWDFYLYMWEATGNNTYERTFLDRVRDVDWLDKRSKCGDIDGDGIEELVWSIGAKVRVYKAVGNNQFQLVWQWQNDHGGDYPHSLVNIYDMNRNGYNEIVVSGWNKTSIFEVEAVKVLRPNGGESFLGRSQELIRWQTFYPPRCDSLSIFFSSDNGRNYEVIATGIPGTDTSYLWQVPNISSDSCKIKIIAYGPGWQYDESDGVFRITATEVEENLLAYPSPLFEIRPNPFQSLLSIHLSPIVDKIKVYNAIGELVRIFSLGGQKTNNRSRSRSGASSPRAATSRKLKTIIWDGRDEKRELLPNGIYLLKLEGKGIKIIKKALLLR